MIYYPLSMLMLAGIRQILIITTLRDAPSVELFLGDGSAGDLKIQYALQHSPDALGQAFLIGESFIGADPSALVLGENIFYGHALPELLCSAEYSEQGATIFVHQVSGPERYGIVEFDGDNKIVGIEDKPAHPKSKFAVTGLYCYDSSVVDYAKQLRPSARGELEITDLNRMYLSDGMLSAQAMGRGYVWLDTGTYESFLEAHQFVQAIEHRQGLKIFYLEEIAFRRGGIDAAQIERLAESMLKNSYSQYFMRLGNGS